MKWDEAFPSNYLNSKDLKPEGINLTIASIDLEDVTGEGKPKDQKPVIRFEGIDKGIVINRTNGEILQNAFGDNMKDVVGKEIKVYRGRTLYMGKMVDCVSIMPVGSVAANRPA